MTKAHSASWAPQVSGGVSVFPCSSPIWSPRPTICKRLMFRTGLERARPSGSKIRCKLGATKDGKLIAAEIWMAYEAGAFPGSPVGAGAMTIVASYNIPHLRIDAYDVAVNRPKTAAYRAPGASKAAFASETHVGRYRCGSGCRQESRAALHGRSGRWSGNSSKLCRRSNARWYHSSWRTRRLRIEAS